MIKKIFLSVLLISLAIGLADLSRDSGSKLGKYDPDELYTLLKKHPNLSNTPPQIFIEALPVEKLVKMTGKEPKEIVYFNEQKPHIFSTGYFFLPYPNWVQGGQILISIYFYQNYGITMEEMIDGLKQYIEIESPRPKVTFLSLGDFGYLKVYPRENLEAYWKELEAFRRSYVPPVPDAPPPVEKTWEDILQYNEGRVEVEFVKGKISFSLTSFKGLLGPEEAIEIAKRFEAIIR